jgi:hypothetical protein
MASHDEFITPAAANADADPAEARPAGGPRPQFVATDPEQRGGAHPGEREELIVLALHQVLAVGEQVRQVDQRQGRRHQDPGLRNARVRPGGTRGRFDRPPHGKRHRFLRWNCRDAEAQVAGLSHQSCRGASSRRDTPI